MKKVLYFFLVTLALLAVGCATTGAKAKPVAAAAATTATATATPAPAATTDADTGGAAKYMTVTASYDKDKDPENKGPEVDFYYNPKKGSKGISYMSVTYGLDDSTYTYMGKRTMSNWNAADGWQGDGFWFGTGGGSEWGTVEWTPAKPISGGRITFNLFLEADKADSFKDGLIYFKSLTVIDGGVSTTYGFSSAKDNPFTEISADPARGCSVSKPTFVNSPDGYPF